MNGVQGMVDVLINDIPQAGSFWTCISCHVHAGTWPRGDGEQWGGLGRSAYLARHIDSTVRLILIDDHLHHCRHLGLVDFCGRTHAIRESTAQVWALTLGLPSTSPGPRTHLWQGTSWVVN